MAAGICLSVALLSWFGYRAIRNSQRNARLLLERRTSDAADLLQLALARDMRGVHDSVLLSSRWTADLLEPPYDITTIVASAFARYPYPESFFGWRGAIDARSIVFFNRLDRLPAWSSARSHNGRFPVVVEQGVPIGGLIVERLVKNKVRDSELSVFEVELAGTPYQFIARLLYEDPFHARLTGGLGFAVNLTWARSAYFPELTRQVGRIGGAREGLSLAIVDDRRTPIVQADPVDARGSISRRPFPLLFFDPSLVALDHPPDLNVREWTIQVAAAGSDATLAAGGIADIRTLVVVAGAAGVLALGLALTTAALRASARLAEMRSEFMSTVTHELKTPLATIRAVGDSVATGRVNGEATLKEYALIVVQESKRLARLVDNVLAYSRITDLTEAYHFEALDVGALVEEALERFAPQLSSGGFALAVDVPMDIPPIRADRSAMQLLLDNLIDNALRYSGSSRWLGIDAGKADGAIRLRISDRGIGIPPEELELVVRKFFRGRKAGSGGSGLGLTIARRIVTDHGGQFTIDSKEGRGTTVTIVLPAGTGHA